MLQLILKSHEMTIKSVTNSMTHIWVMHSRRMATPPLYFTVVNVRRGTASADGVQNSTPHALPSGRGVSRDQWLAPLCPLREGLVGLVEVIRNGEDG